MSVNTGFYDTNVLIAYLFEEKNRVNVAEKVIMKHLVKSISIISIHEIHLHSIRYGVEDRFKLVKQYIEKLFKIESLDQETCLEASRLRKEYGLPEIDSLILATAITNNYTYFYSFDKDFEKLDNKKIRNTTIYYLK